MSEAIWRGLAEKALAGRPFDTLTSLTRDGIRIEPLYGRSRVEAPLALRQRPGAWAVAQRVDHPDAAEANRLALIDLEGGANALALVFATATARGFGLPYSDEALATALESVDLDFIALRLDAGSRTPEAIKTLAALTKARRLTSASLAIDCGFDPIGVLARLGTEAATGAPDDVQPLLALSRDAGFAGCLLLADGRPYHEAGAAEAQELASVLATGIAYLRLLERDGLTLADASATIAFLLAADADTFLTIAKFRALRRLWARVEDACGLAPKPIRLHAETAWRMMTRRDPWMNVMRATGAVFAAGLGGADVVTALPFTLPLGLPDDGARRLARNSQLVLLDESHLAAVDDPAAGSGGLEGLTEQLCVHAWTLFQQIEREGGIEASLRAGAIQARIAETAARRAEAVATLEQGITGTSTFPPLDRGDHRVIAVAPRPNPPKASFALPTVRDAEPFERLYARTDALAAGLGRRPAVFLATLGAPASYGPRATYAVNFFAAAGLETVMGAADGDLRDYDADQTPVVCLCAAETFGADKIALAIDRLRKAGARRVLLAGRPPAEATTGVDDTIHLGCNALQVLARTLEFVATKSR